MKHNSKPYCRFAKKIDNFLEEGREQLFSYKPKSNKGLFTRKYNHIKLPHFASHLEANLPESQPPASKHLQENQKECFFFILLIEIGLVGLSLLRGWNGLFPMSRKICTSIPSSLNQTSFLTGVWRIGSAFKR